MMALANTTELVADGVLTAEQAQEIEARSRAAMTGLAINAVLCFGILAATGGLIFWLAAPLPVAVFGALALAVGAVILARGGETFRIFGNAATLIGAGMLIGGASFELLDKAEDVAGWVMFALGAGIAGVAAFGLRQSAAAAQFTFGAVLLMGLAAHLVGLGVVAEQLGIGGWARAAAFLYTSMALALAGWWIDVRLITALAIVPFAQMLDTGTEYFFAAYVFYSPESTLTILQMAALIALAVLLSRGWADRDARHARVLSVLALVVLNLAALVGSLWGDVVGAHVWGPRATLGSDVPWADRRAAMELFEETALVITEGAYSIGWAILLVALILWAARAHHRGLFNTALTFGFIHAYTQLFESFGDEPLAYVIGGLAAIPLAWGMWWLNRRFTSDAPPVS